MVEGMPDILALQAMFLKAMGEHRVPKVYLEQSYSEVFTYLDIVPDRNGEMDYANAVRFTFTKEGELMDVPRAAPSDRH
jgi:hypothetical protein